MPWLMALAALSVLPLQELPPQAMAKQSCAMFLWDRASKQRVVMAVAVPPTIRVMRDGKPVTLARIDAGGAEVMGFPASARFGDGRMTVGFDLVIVPNDAGGAVVRDGVVTVTEADGSAVVAPVAGLVGCQP